MRFETANMTVENWFGSAGDLSLLVTAVKVLRQTGKFIWDTLYLGLKYLHNLQNLKSYCMMRKDNCQTATGFN
jgi:hypothetical protein